ncbi:hypothetical protein ACFY2N_29635 [Streptomyces rubiginosohelvolus]|uniref:hypothetical protein n=1 Tax=Streptomyces rubiginosohelvolus TaxID=67362 RepID=UPI00368F5ACB
MEAAENITNLLGVGKPPAPSRWRGISDGFAIQMFSLLHISDSLIPQMGKTLGESDENPISRLFNLLSEEEGKEFSEVLVWAVKELGVALKKVEQGEVQPEGDGSVKKGSGASFSVRSSNVSAAFIQLVHDVVTGAPVADNDTLRKSLLVTSVSNFEVLFGKLAEEIYGVNKSALNNSDYTFSLQQLGDFDSLEDARQFLVERRVSALMRDSVDGWDKWLSGAVKGVSMAALPVDWKSTREVFARRNIVVHNGGVVNRMYISSLAQAGVAQKDLKLGAQLKIDSDYFSQAVQNILALGMILVAEIGRRLNKEASDELNQGLLFNADAAVRRKAWVASTAITSYLLSGKLNRASQLRAQMLNWVARKGMGEVDQVHKEVAGWDISGLSEEFSHYKAVLLGEKEEAIKVVEDLISGGKLALVEVALHPAYAELHDELPSLVARKQSASSSKKVTAAKKATKKVAKRIPRKPVVEEENKE